MGFYLSNPAKKVQLIRDDSNQVYEASRKITEVYNSSSFYGRRCFLVGGGPSLKGFDFSRLDGELSIGVNRTFEYYSCTINYLMDVHVYDWIHTGELTKHAGHDVKELWYKSSSLKVFLTPLNIPRSIPFGPEVYFVKRLNNMALSLVLEEGIYSGGNSGFGALQLACALGCREIYLLGYDMKAPTQTHWHNGYANQQSLADAAIKLDSFKLAFNQFRAYYENFGIKVINLGPDSSLTCFESRKLDEVLLPR